MSLYRRQITLFSFNRFRFHNFYRNVRGLPFYVNPTDACVFSTGIIVIFNDKTVFVYDFDRPKSERSVREIIIIILETSNEPRPTSTKVPDPISIPIPAAETTPVLTAVGATVCPADRISRALKRPPDSPATKLLRIVCVLRYVAAFIKTRHKTVAKQPRRPNPRRRNNRNS